MERVKPNFEKILLDYLQERAINRNGDGEPNYEVLADKEKKHYQLLRKGWRNDAHYLYSILLHFEIKNNKVWVLQNLTEDSVAKDLTEKGVPASQIVLGFQPEHRRQFSGYAVN